MTDVKPYLSVIVLNVKSLDIPIKTQIGRKDKNS